MDRPVAKASERDLLLVQRAAVYEADGVAALTERIPHKVRAIKRANLTTTVGPQRFAFRSLAKEEGVVRAQAAFQAADALYWELVLEWSNLVYGLANRKERQLGLPCGDLVSAYLIAGFNTAIRLDPERSNFGTYFPYWARQAVTSAPELRTLVHLPHSLGSIKGRVPMSSLDEPHPDGGDLPVDRTPGEVLNPERALELKRMDLDWVMRKMLPYLRYTHKVVMEARLQGCTLREIGAKQGFTKQNASYAWMDAEAIFAHVMAGKPPKRPCQWPQCREDHLAHGMCLKHTALLTPEEYERIKAGPLTFRETNELVAAVKAR